MAFLKIGIATNVQVVRGPYSVYSAGDRAPVVGDEKAGLVWDGEHWIPKADWEARVKADSAKKD